VWTGQDWVPERRFPGRETYANGICPECTVKHFVGSSDRKRLNVQLFRMGAPAMEEKFST
jgi:hypothetical protein